MSSRSSRLHKRKERSPSFDAGSVVGSDGPAVLRSSGVDGTPRKKAKAVSVRDAPTSRSQVSGGGGRNVAGGKARASPRSKDLLPAVTITSRQGRSSVATRVVSPSIGDVSGDEIDSVVAASVRDESDCDADPVVTSFVDVEAEESDGDARSLYSAADNMKVDWEADSGRDADSVGVAPGGRGGSGDEEDDGSALSDVNDDGSIDFSGADLSKRSARVSVKTEKGKYVDSLITSGQHSDVATDDDDFLDPTVTSAQVQVSDSRVAHDAESSSVYLDDLYPDPILPRRELGARATVLGRRGGKRGGSNMSSPSNRKLDINVSVSKSDAVFDKTLVLAAPERSYADVDVDRVGSSVPKSKVVRTQALPVDADSPSGAKKRGKARKEVAVTQTATPPKSPSPKKRGNVSAVASEPRALRSSSRAKSSAGAASKRGPASPASAGGSSDTPMSGVAASIMRLSGAKLRDAIGRLIGSPERDSSPEVDVTRPVLRMSSETRIVSSIDNSLDMTEPDDPELRVMLARFMEFRLVQLKVYENMALIGPFRPVIPVGFKPDTYETPVYYTFDDVASLYKISSLTSLVEMFSFSHYGAFVNPARAPLGTLTVMNRKASVSNETAVCLMSGVVTECLLFDSTVIGGYKGASGVHGGKRMHRIRIKPFHQIWRRDQTVWAVTFDLPYGEATCISDSGIQFPTRMEDLVGKTNKNSRFPSSPATPSRWKSVPKALKAASPVPGAGYASSMGFADDIPIYDGRDRAGSHFLFRPSDFDNLTALPRYTIDRDLDAFTLVTVGYSLGVWSSYNDRPRVGTNVLFVIVLGSAPSRSVLKSRNLLA